MADRSLESLYSLLGYHFQDPTLVEQALTHASQRTTRVPAHYERLEFLGDRVLGLVIAEILFQAFPTEPEGALAKRLAYLVSREALMEVAKTLNLEAYIRVSKSVETFAERRRSSILADVCEALIGALYLEAGLDIAKKFVQKHWAPLLAQTKQVPQDPKSLLQEWAQSHGHSPPTYTLVRTEGPDHAPLFTLKVQGKGFPPQEGTAPSKRQAQQIAAQKVLESLELL